MKQTTLKRRGWIAAACVCMLTVLCGTAVLPRLHADAYTQTELHDFSMVMAPSAITEIVNEQAYSYALEAESKPSSVIVRVDEALRVRTVKGNDLGSMQEIIEDLAKANILAVFRLQDSAAATAFAAYAKEKSLTDYCITGSDGDVLASAKAQLPAARVCYDFRGNKKEKAYDYIPESRRAGAHIVLLDAEQADSDTVRYLQGMMTTVWVAVSDLSAVSVTAAITCGAYGIVAAYADEIYEACEKFPYGSIPRSYYNIGHRGLPITQAENSLKGCIAAYESGATHVEIDIQVSADDKLIVMHDDTINRTTNGSGAVSSYTSAQLENYQIVKTYKGKETEPEKIPTLDEIFAYFADKDIVIVVEIKNSNSKCCELLKACIEQYNMWEKTVVISFLEEQLHALHALMPQVPCATLNGVLPYNFQQYVADAAQYNFGFDCAYIQMEYDFSNSQLKDRGYMAWNWTYEGFSSVHAAAESGIVGITNNSAEAFADNIKKWILPASFSLDANEKIEDKAFSVQLLTFGGETITADVKAFVWEETNEGYRAILRYNDNGAWVYGDAVTVLAEKAEEEEKGGGCGSAIGTSLPVLGMLFMSAAGLLVRRRKAIKL